MAAQLAYLRPAGSQGLEAAVFRAAFDQAPVAVGVCDGDGRFVAANPMLGRLLAVDPKDLVGRPFLTFVRPDARAASLATYFQSVVAAAVDSLVRSDSHELPCVTADGSVVWVSVTWTMTAPNQANEQFGVVHLLDITQRRRADRQLAELNQRFELAFQCSPVGFAVVDLQGRIMQTNAALQQMFGYDRQELQNRSFLDITHPDDRAASVEVFSALLAGDIDRDNAVKRYRTRAGSTVYARRVAALLRDGSTPRYFLLQIEDITGEQQARAALRERAVRDPLTGLASRESLNEELVLPGMPRCVVVVRLVDLPRLNAALGRSGSDTILVEVARRLTRSCRAQDRVARVGSGQFAILITDDAVPPLLVQRITAALAEPIAVGERTVVVKSAVGSVQDPTGEQDLDSLLQRGDITVACERSTDEDGSWTQFNAAMMNASFRQIDVESELRTALATGGLSVAYQPIIDLATGVTRAFEVLSRWRHDTLGDISATEIVTAAERSGLIHELTTWSLRTACAELASWIAATPEAGTIAIAVNIAPRCLTRPDFAGDVHDALAASGLAGRNLILEITEDNLAHDCDTVLDNLHRLQAENIRIAIDDFGTGQSCLARVARYPVTEVKLDRSFLAEVRDPDDEAPSIRAAIAMARELNLTLTAEGVETTAHLDLLRRYGCPQAQGFLLGRPHSAVRTREGLKAQLAFDVAAPPAENIVPAAPAVPGGLSSATRR